MAHGRGMLRGMPGKITVEELSLRLASGKPTMLVDVREPWEHATAALPGGVLVPLSVIAERWQEIVRPAEPGAEIVTYCHHGVRSLNAAAFLEAQGLGPVLSLAGGIDAWSLQVDPAVPRY
jgi:rhodanese-related sulfurtransferase